MSFPRPGWRLLALTTLAILLALAWAVTTSGDVQAHGDLEKSNPRANSVVTKSPDQVVLFMSEAPEPAFSEIKVFSKDGVRVDTEDTRLSGKTRVAVGLEPLEPGTYTVVWQVTSVSDGHRTSGTFRFTVSGGGRLFLGTGGGTSQTLADTRPTPGNTAIRWGELLGLSLVAGAIGTLIALWRPLLPVVSTEGRSRVIRRTRILALAGLGLVGIALIADLLSKASDNTWEELGFIQALLDILLESQIGVQSLLRLLVSAVLGVLWFRLIREEGNASARILGLVAGLSALLLLGRSLGSHAAGSAGSPAALNVAVDFIHLAAACLWIGGLVALLLGLQVLRRGDGQLIGPSVARFSNLAILSVGLIALTGLYNAWLEVGSVGAFLETSYGKILLVKMSILVPLLGLAAINLFGVRIGRVSTFGQHAAGTMEGAGRGLGLRIQGEVTLALVILLMTALLANLPLARDAIDQKASANEAPMAMPVLLEEREVNVTFAITPNQVGINGFLLELHDPLGNPIEEGALVAVRFSRLDQDISGDTLILKPRGPGQFSAKSDVLSIVGTWVATVTIATGQDSPLTIDYLVRVPDRTQNRKPVITGIIDFLSGREPELPGTGPLVASGADAEAGLTLLRRADSSMNLLRSVHECNNINGVVTLLGYDAPERMRYAVKGGGESIISGNRQWYSRSGTPWRFQLRNSGFRFPSFTYADDAEGVRMEGNHQIEGRLHHVVSFYSPRDDADYWFWIDAETYRIGQLVMNVPPSHYMVSIFDDFDAGEGIPIPSDTGDHPARLSSFPERVSCQSYLP